MIEEASTRPHMNYINITFFTAYVVHAFVLENSFPRTHRKNV